MTIIQPVSSLSIKKAVNLYTIVLFISFACLLYWLATDRHQSFIDSHKNTAESTSKILAYQISKSLIEKQRESDIFVDDYKHMLANLAARPYDDNIRSQLSNRLKKYQPDFIDFSILSNSASSYSASSNAGSILFGNLTDDKDKSCIEDIQQFIKTGDYQFRLHSSNGNYHYDILSKMSFRNSSAIVLFRFSINEFSDLLSSSQTAKHELVLVNNIAGRSVGMTAQGDIKKIIGGLNFKILNGANLSTIAKTKIKGTDWYVVDMSDANLFTDHVNKILTEYFIAFYIFAMIVLFMRHILLKQDAKRSLAEDQLKKNHDQIKVLNNSLERLSKSDSLTNLYNRRHFDQVIQQEWNRGLRSNDTLACILLDIDHFKKYNDLYGHQAGDKCIKDITALLRDTFRRAGDTVARYGGEEFIVAMATCSEEEAKVALIKFQLALKKLKIKHQASDTDEYVTVSAGLAAQIPSQNTSVEKLIRHADEALYRAKHNGRNQFVVFDAEDSNWKSL